MSKTKDLVEEALLQMKNVEDVIAENAKGILASTMKEEISQLVKESLSEQEEDDEIEIDAEIDTDDVSDDADELEMDSDDMEFDDEEEDVIDLTNASDEEILAIFKRMGDEDGIIVKKDGDDVHIKDTNDDVEYLVKMNEEEEEEYESYDEMEESYDEMEEGAEMEEDDSDLQAVLDALYQDDEMEQDEEMEEDVMYEIVMDEDDDDDDDEMEESYDEMEEGEEMEESYDEMEEGEEMEESYDEMEEGSEEYHLEEAKMTVKPKGVGMGNPKFNYGKTLPKKGFDDHKKQGPTKMGTGKPKFEFKEGEMEEAWGSKKKEYKRTKGHKTGDVKGHYKDYEGKVGGNKGDKSKTNPGKKDYEKMETKEAARTYGFGSKEGRGLRKGITNNRNYVYSNNGVKVESVDAEIKMLREKNEEYRKALNVFREKLNEVAVFNSNLAYATRLFTEHSTTKKEKINILRRFDSVESLKESKQLYKTMKDELTKIEAPSLNESVERKINNQATSGSSTSLIESRAYENPQFLRIKDLMNKL